MMMMMMMMMCVRAVDYSVETIVLKWIQPNDKAVQFDPGGEDKSQFIIRKSLLRNCSYNKTDGLSHQSRNRIRRKLKC